MNINVQYAVGSAGKVRLTNCVNSMIQGFYILIMFDSVLRRDQGVGGGHP